MKQSSVAAVQSKLVACVESRIHSTDMALTGLTHGGQRGLAANVIVYIQPPYDELNIINITV